MKTKQKKYMRRIAAIGGSVTSKAKRKAAKLNGTNGGRPKKGETRAEYLVRKFGIKVITNPPYEKETRHD